MTRNNRDGHCLSSRYALPTIRLDDMHSQESSRSINRPLEEYTRQRGEDITEFVYGRGESKAQ